MSVSMTTMCSQELDGNENGAVTETGKRSDALPVGGSHGMRESGLWHMAVLQANHALVLGSGVRNAPVEPGSIPPGGGRSGGSII